MASADSTFISIGAASEYCGCHPNTLRKYANNGQLLTYRRLGGKRKFLRSDLDNFFELKKENVNGDGGETGRILIYARISDGRRSKGFNKGETSDLQRQVSRLTEYAANNYGDIEPTIYADTGSGLSFQRKQFNRLIDGMLNGSIKDATLLLTHPERLARIAREVIEKICDAVNVKIIYTEKDENLDDESTPGELIAEFCSSVISRIYSKRSAERYKKRLSPNVINRIVELRATGLPYSKIQKILNDEKLRCNDGAAVGIAVIQRYLNEKAELEVKNKNSIEKYYAENIVHGASNLRLKKEILWADYETWCKNRGITPLGAFHVGKILTQMGLETTTTPDKSTGSKLAWKSVYIKEKSELSVSVKEKKQSIGKSPEKDNHNSFIPFYNEHLAGKFRGYSRQIWNDYKSYCKAQNCRQISFRLVPKLILELSGVVSQKFGTGGLIYDLRGAKSQVLSLAEPRPVLWCRCA